MDVLHLQLLVAAGIGISCSAFGLAPILLPASFGRRLVPRSSTRARLLSGATCFGAGVFIFVCFMGLLPEADAKFHTLMKEFAIHNPEWTNFVQFPWGYLVLCCGFLIIFTIDKVVHALDPANHSHGNKVPSDDHSNNNEPEIVSLKGKYSSLEDVTGNTGDGGHGVPSSVIFLLALCLHSVFEGIAIGLQDENTKIVEFAVAVVTHEVVMAFTFGLQVSKSPVMSRLHKVLYVLLFTCSIPVGVLIGLGLQNAPSDNTEMISAICEAFATGIFIHIIFIEILEGEFSGHHVHDEDLEDGEATKPRNEACVVLEKIFFICVGFGVMIALSTAFMHPTT